MALILGIGVGLFILAVVWTVTILLSIVFFRVNKLRPAAGGLILLSSLLTIILTLYPREGTTPEPADIVITDQTFMGRVVLLAFFSFFVLLSLILLFMFHWTEPITAQPIKSKRY